jgi:hypothetical protein
MLPINGFGRNMGKPFTTGFQEFMWSRGCDFYTSLFISYPII